MLDLLLAIQNGLLMLGKLPCGIPEKYGLPVGLGFATIVFGAIFGVARNVIVDHEDRHVGHYMVGGDLMVAAGTVCGSEVVARSVRISCGGNWTNPDLQFLVACLFCLVVILLTLMLTINHDRIGVKLGPKVPPYRVLLSNFWGALATLLAVGVTTTWTNIGG